MSFVEETRNALAAQPLARAARTIAQATAEFEDAIAEAVDADRCRGPESFELKPEPDEHEGGVGTGAFILDCDFADRRMDSDDLMQLTEVLSPLMRKWGVAYIQGASYDTDSCWLWDVPGGLGAKS